MSSVKNLDLVAPTSKIPAAPQLKPAPRRSREEDADVLSVAKSVVKIFTNSSSPDAGQPWQLSRGQLSTGSGWFLEYNGEKFIITNAHCVVQFTTVQIKKYGSPRKWPATVLFIADTCDLAVLTVEDKAFWHNTPALTLSDVPQLNSPCFVIGYPTGGDELSYSKGVVSRVEMQTYAHSSDTYLALQIDAAINSGNSGGPVVAPTEDGFVCIGVAFETLNGANSIGYVIAPPVVLNMLQSFKTNNPGCPSLNLITQAIESQTMRNSLYIPSLAGLIDYLFDLNALSTSLIEVAKEQGFDLDGLEPEVEKAITEGTVDPAATAATAADDHDDDKTHEAFGTPEAVIAADNASTGMGKIRSPTASEKEAAAQHWVIGQDEEYDYVVFKPQTEIQDEDGDEDAEGELELDLNNLDLGQFSPKTQDAIKEEIQKAIDSGTIGDMVQVEEGSQEEDDVLTLGDENTPIYRIKRTSVKRPMPPIELLPLLISDRGLFDTQIGISIRSIIPYTDSADLFKEGDVILAIDNIPVSSDETILFRDNERVRFSFLTSNKQIGDKCTVLILRGFDIVPIEVKIQRKQTVAKLFDYSTPNWLVALGLVFAPLSGNLMQAEFGEEWTSESPITLLEALFLGSLKRFHPDEQVVVLTQILSHTSTEGYDMAMQRLTHVNGERVINMKHLATILHNAVEQYEKNREIAEKIAAGTASPTEATLGHDGDLDVDEDMEPSELQKLFSKQLQTMGRINYITFTLLSGQVITLSLADGHQKQLEILKLHQIPLPGASEALIPMYSMEVKVNLTGATGASKAPTDANVLLQPKPLKPSKSITNAQILSPTPLSPRDSNLIIPPTEKLYSTDRVTSPFGAKQARSGSDAANSSKPESTKGKNASKDTLIRHEELIDLDKINPTSPRETLDKFAKALKQRNQRTKQQDQADDHKNSK